MSKKNGGAAFPVLTQYSDNRVIPRENGMTLRDYFAAKAMQGDWSAGLAGNNGETAERAAKRYYMMADAMLAERDRHD